MTAGVVRLHLDERAEMDDQARWEDRAACRTGHDPSDWDVAKSNDVTIITDEVRAAQAVCGQCPVRLECLTNAVRFNRKWAIFGGMTDEQRDAWAREHGLAA